MRLLASVVERRQDVRELQFLAHGGEEIRYVASVEVGVNFGPDETNLGKLVVRDGHLCVVRHEAAEELTSISGGEVVVVMYWPKGLSAKVNAGLVRLSSGQLVVVEFEFLVTEQEYEALPGVQARRNAAVGTA